MINSERLLIKPFSEEDAEKFWHLSCDEGFALFPITIYRQESAEAARQWLRSAVELNQKTGLGKWGVWEKTSGELIGMGGLTPWQWEGENLIDITYRLRASAWGRGYGHELARSLMDYGFGVINLDEITATITPDNKPSLKIAHKLGLKFDQEITLLGVRTHLFRLKHPADEEL